MKKRVVSVLLALSMAMSLGLSGCSLFSSNSESADSTGEAVSADAVVSADAAVESNFQVNAIEGINSLFTDYYTSYASGDTGMLQQLAYPFSDRELQYISLMSQYIDSYSDFIIYSKDGVNAGEYIVSVSMKIHFTGIETPAPGVETFYVKTGENGNYYIDNSYSSYNLSAQESETDPTILNFINSYNSQSDVVQLFNEVNAAYQQALAGDEALQNLMNTTIPNAVSSWNETGTIPSIENASETDAASTEDTSAEDVTADDSGEDTSGADVTEDGSEDTSDQLSYIPEGKKITITDPVRVRKSMSESAKVLGTAVVGDTVTVIMSYEEGWTKVTWGDETGYIKTDLLQTQ